MRRAQSCRSALNVRAPNARTERHRLSAAGRPYRHFCVHGATRRAICVGLAVRQLLRVAMGEQASVAGGEDETLDLPCATSLEIPGRTIERYVGLCWGLTVRSVGFSKGSRGPSARSKPARSRKIRTSWSKHVTTRSSASSSTPALKALPPSPACASTRVRSASSSRRSSPTAPQS